MLKMKTAFQIKNQAFTNMFICIKNNQHKNAKWILDGKVQIKYSLHHLQPEFATETLENKILGTKRSFTRVETRLVPFVY